MKEPTIIIATPHHRNDQLEATVREKLAHHDVVRIRSRDELSLAMLERIKPDFIFFPHWSWVIPEEIHSTCECVIFHMTDLPYGRGGSPLQNLIVRGHKDTVISAIRCVTEIDAGSIYLKRPLSLEGTAEEILQRASKVIAAMISAIVEESLTPVPQQGEIVEFKRRKASDGDIGSLNELSDVFDYIRMLDAEGYPAAFLKTDRLMVEFSDATLGDESVEAKVKIRKIDNE